MQASRLGDGESQVSCLGATRDSAVRQVVLRLFEGWGVGGRGLDWRFFLNFSTVASGSHMGLLLIY